MQTNQRAESEAVCSCGALHVRCKGEPELLSICHCDGCRRRTGSAMGISAFYRRGLVSIAGETTLFTKTVDDGRTVRYHFCPRCGSTLYWEPSWRPDEVGVGAGAFCHPLREPDQSVDDDNRFDWIELPLSVRRR
jgi:hypothetical protein